MLGITAILIKSKTYNHVSGSQTVPRGTVIKVVPSTPSDSLGADGSDNAECSGAFYGLHNGELFDIEPSDFRAVN